MKLLRFLNTKIDLSCGAFFPREETKYWTKKVIEEIKKEEGKGKKIKILDLFTGSGCIGIAILKNTKDAKCVFGDIDEKYLEQVKINLFLNNISNKRAKTVKTNIFSNIKEKFDYIVANPPYVAKERLNEVQFEVKKYDPKIAWYGGKGGLVIIKKFLKEAKNFLNKNGKIYLEIDPYQVEDIKKIFEKEGYKNFKFYKDQFGKIRFVKIS